MIGERPTSEDELTELVRSIDVPAPPALRARVEEMVAAAPARRRTRLRSAAARGDRSAGALPRARPLAAALAGAVAIAALVVALTAGGGGHSALSLDRAAAPALRASTTPAPGRNGDSQFLAAAVGDVRFPYLEDALGWRASGSRTDTIAGHAVTTVFYSRGSSRVGYAIYAGLPATSREGSVRRQYGIRFHVVSNNGTAIISWTRSGDLCVMASHGASADALIRLAGWGTGATAA
jgi:hypothetical protein